MRYLAAALCLAAMLTGSSAQESGPGKIAAGAFPKPSRPVASIISPIWHSEDARDAVKEVPQVVRLLGIEPGMTVADIGAGSGYYAIRLSPILGPSGRVIAEDITPAYLKLLEQKIRDLHLDNVTVTAGKPADPMLSAHSVDRAILIHMYHEISEPFELLYNLASALKPGAEIGIVDAKRPTLQHGTPPSLLRCEVEAMGYRETGLSDLEGSEAYLAIFVLPAGTAPHLPDATCRE